MRRFHLFPTTRPTVIRGYAYLRWLWFSWIICDPLHLLPGMDEPSGRENLT